MRKDVREFIRRLETAGLEVEPTPGHYRVLREGSRRHRPLTHGLKCRSRTTFRSPGFDGDTFSPGPAPVELERSPLVRTAILPGHPHDDCAQLHRPYEWPGSDGLFIVTWSISGLSYQSSG